MLNVSQSQSSSHQSTTNKSLTNTNNQLTAPSTTQPSHPSTSEHPSQQNSVSKSKTQTSESQCQPTQSKFTLSAASFGGASRSALKAIIRAPVENEGTRTQPTLPTPSHVSTTATARIDSATTAKVHSGQINLRGSMDKYLEVYQFAVSFELLDRHYDLNRLPTSPVDYKMPDLLELLDDARETLHKCKTLEDITADLFIVGDIHGQFNDLLAIFRRLGIPPTKRYLFLGDYVDRGQLGLECAVLLLAYKIVYPDFICLLRGNHECARINKSYGFYDELKMRFGRSGRKLWLHFNKVFDELPAYALIEDKIFCMHGGLSPKIESLDHLRNYPKPIRNPTTCVINDSLWSDPDFDIKGFHPSQRGTSFTFGEDVVKSACETFQIDLIVRAHQVCLDGYWFFAGKRMLTIFSAPNYCGTTDNAGAVLHVDSKLMCTLHLFAPADNADSPIVQRIMSGHLKSSPPGSAQNPIMSCTEPIPPQTAIPLSTTTTKQK